MQGIERDRIFGEWLAVHKGILFKVVHAYAFEHADRQALHRLRVRLGPLDVFVDPLLKPAAQFWRAALLSVRTGQPMPALPVAGAATLTSEADARGVEVRF